MSKSFKGSSTTRNRLKSKRKKNLAKENFKERLRYFLANTTVHGMKYLLRKPYFMEFIWMTALVALLSLMGCRLYSNVYKHKNTMIGLSIDTNYLNWTHKFPAFSICHRQREFFF